MLQTSNIGQYKNAIVSAGGSIIGYQTAKAGYNMARNYFRNSLRNPSRGRLSTRARQRNARSYTLTKTRNRKKTKSGSGVTTQQDRRIQYQRRPMPRYKKAKWKSFVKKVNAVNEKDLGTRQAVFNVLRNSFNSAVNEQVYGNLALYGMQSAYSWLNDLYYIGQYENTAAGTPTLGDTVWGSTKFIFTSGVLDVTFRNSSGIVRTTPGVWETTGEAKIELDIYEISMSKPAEIMTNTVGTADYFDDFNELFSYSLGQQQKITNENVGAPGGKADHYKRGVTPFDNSYALAKFGIKIWKKTKYFIPNNDTITYQIRDPRRHVVMRKDLGSTGGFNKKGMTRHLYYVAKLVPGLTQNSGAIGSYVPSLDIGITRKYVYKVEGVTDDRNTYQNL